MDQHTDAGPVAQEVEPMTMISVTLMIRPGGRGGEGYK